MTPCDKRKKSGRSVMRAGLSLSTPLPPASEHNKHYEGNDLNSLPCDDPKVADRRPHKAETQHVDAGESHVGNLEAVS